jgi:ubiquinone biosynthesis protein UbiJ
VQIVIYKNEVQNPVQAPTQVPAVVPYITAQMNFIFRARMLYRDLATWLRSYKVSLYGDVGNTDELSKRLFRLPTEYGSILRVFFGDPTTEQLMSLLRKGIMILMQSIALLSKHIKM